MSNINIQFNQINLIINRKILNNSFMRLTIPITLEFFELNDNLKKKSNV